MDLGDAVVALGAAQRAVAGVKAGVTQQVVAPRVGVRAAIAAEQRADFLRRRRGGIRRIRLAVSRRIFLGRLRAAAAVCAAGGFRRRVSVVKADVLHQQVQTAHGVVAQSAGVTLTAAVQPAMRLVLRPLGRDVRAPVAVPEGTRHATPPSVVARRRTAAASHVVVGFSAVYVEVCAGSFAIMGTRRLDNAAAATR